MRLKGKSSLWLLLLMPMVYAGPRNYTRFDDLQSEPEIRGQSFGLENFLTQPLSFDESTENTNINMEMKRIRNGPRNGMRKKPVQERGQTYGLESMAPVLTEPLDVEEQQPQTTPKPVERQQRLRSRNHAYKPNLEADKPYRPLEINQQEYAGESMKNFHRNAFQNVGVRKSDEELQRPPEVVEVTENEEEKQAPSSERPRKRIMKRRRKRPTKIARKEEEQQSENIEKNDEQIEVTPEPDRIPPNPTTAQLEKKRKRPIGFRNIPNQINHDPSPSDVSTEDDFRNNDNLDKSFTTDGSIDRKTIVRSGPEVRMPSLEVRSSTENSEEKNTPPVPIPPPKSLKTLLNQHKETLSLSEILQTQNLSLADFLKANKGAIAALGKKVETNEEEQAKPKKEKLVPAKPTISVRSRPFSKPILEVNQDANKISHDDELESTQSTAERPTYNGFLPKNPRIKQNQFNSLLNKKHQDEKPQEEESENTPRIVEKTEATTESAATSTSSENVIDKRLNPKRFNDLRSKLRIERRKFNSNGETEDKNKNLIGKDAKPSTEAPESETEASPAPSTEANVRKKSRVRIPFMSTNNAELSLILPNKNKTAVKETTREKPQPERVYPFRKYHNHENLRKIEANSSENTINEKAQKEESKIKNQEIQREPPKYKRVKVPNVSKEDSEESKEKTEDPKDCDDKETTDTLPDIQAEAVKFHDEIIELLRYGSTAKTLENILASRNMTIAELLENREKGSAAISFTEIFDEQKDSNNKNKDAYDVPEYESSKSSSKKLDSRHDQTGDDELEAEESVVRHVTVKPDHERQPKVFESFPAFESKATTKSGSTPQDGPLKVVIPIWDINEKVTEGEEYYKKTAESETTPLKHIEIGRTTEKTEVNNHKAALLENIRKSQDADRKRKYEEGVQEPTESKTNHDNIDKSFIPPAVKSAIIASGAVLGIALFVFVAIFAACGWRQRQIKLKARSSILNDTIHGTISEKKVRRSNTLSPVSFKRSNAYKKPLDFDETGSSLSGSSKASSYLWNTLRNTFTSRNSTLKNRLEKEEKMREDQFIRSTLKREDLRNHFCRDEAKKQQQQQENNSRSSTLPRPQDKFVFKKMDTKVSEAVSAREEYKRVGGSNSHRFNSCSHRNFKEI